MIACWPNVIRKGSVSEHISAFWDVLPTLGDIVGYSHTETDGISFYPELVGKKQPKHDYLYWELPEGDGSKALRMGKWKGYMSGIKKEADIWNCITWKLTRLKAMTCHLLILKWSWRY